MMRRIPCACSCAYTPRFSHLRGLPVRVSVAPAPAAWLFLGLFWAAASTGHAGTIQGTVRANPPAVAAGQVNAAESAYESRRYKYVEKLDYSRMRDFVVYIDQPPGDLAPAAASQMVKTTQKDASFEPHVLPVVVGSTVRWPNEDDIFHNVFSMSGSKAFDLGYYKKEKVPEVRFDRVGRVDVFCAIHPKMHCIILVLPNPHFAAADNKGRFVINDVPEGTYQLRAWHERIPSQVKEIVVPAEGEVTIDFVLGFGQLPKS